MSDQKNTLIALIFDDLYKADEARAALHRMEGDGLLEIDETAVIVRKAHDKVRISQDINVVAKDKHVGHVIGLVAAAATGTLPFIMAGTIAGDLIGKLTDHGITNKFLKQVGKEVGPGTSALVMKARSDPERRKRIAERLSVFGPKVLESDLPPELEREINSELQGDRRAATLNG